MAAAAAWMLTAACVLLAVCVVNITAQSSLTDLYNSRVTSATRYSRPLGSSSGLPYSLDHDGVVVTTAGGGRYLVHKGKRYGGRGGQTVVTDASHMSSRWHREGRPQSVSGVSVGDYVRAGGTNYQVLWDNCYGAADRMMRLGNNRRHRR